MAAKIMIDPRIQQKDDELNQEAQCLGATKLGSQCRNTALPNEELCHSHHPNHAQLLKAANRDRRAQIKEVGRCMRPTCAMARTSVESMFCEKHSN